MTSTLISVHFDANAPMVIITDASQIALGAVLSQVSNQVEQPIAYVSKTLQN